MPILTIVTSKADRRIEFCPGQSLREVLDAADCRVRTGCRGTGACGLCRVAVRAGEVNEPTLAERLHLSIDRIMSGERLACQVRAVGNTEVVILNTAPQSSWKAIPSAFRYGGRHVGLPASPHANPVIDVKHPYGVAVDLGTTHISLSFCDLTTREWFTGRRGSNPQGRFGTDIMTRLMAACESPSIAQAMRMGAVNAIGDAVADVTTREGIGAEQVVKVVLGGNTAMLALLSGRNHRLLLEPKHWLDCIDCLPQNLADLALSWGINPRAHIEVLPPLAGFVGSDLLGGLIATNLVEAGEGSLFIDFGTNSEIALWDGTILRVTSAAGGPAFEGCGISCGMPAEPGAIYQVRVLTGPNLDFRTINGENPLGFCGSGMVDLIACLLRSGKLNSRGCFAADVPRGRIVLLNGERRMTLTKRDVDVFQRAKGAISAAVRVLLSMARMKSSDLQHVFVGGAFGHFLDRHNAISIGLLPDVSHQSIELCGNTALAGFEHLLLLPDSTEVREKILSRVRLINLAHSTDFEDFFLEGLYLSRC